MKKIELLSACQQGHIMLKWASKRYFTKKLFTLGLLFWFCLLANPTLLRAQDTDGDGILDSIDLDDDNDGIPDDQENCKGKLKYEFYDLVPTGNTLNNFPTTGAMATGYATIFNPQNLQKKYTPDDAATYSIKYSGYFNAESAAEYTFVVRADDAARLIIDGTTLVDIDGLSFPVPRSKTGKKTLSPGLHSFTILFFYHSGTPPLLIMTYATPTITARAIPFSLFYSSDNCDTDGDGIPNTLDLDSDNDGIPDIVEAGGVDANGDGRVDNFTDTDGDGLADVYDSDNGGTPLSGFDIDGDGINNFQDLDSDSDGITDIVEAGGTDTNEDGKADSFTDTDGDGWANTFDPDNGGTSLPVKDSDGDGKANFLDLDSDNDGLTDIFEAEGYDYDFNGKGDAILDSDYDGLLDIFDIDQGGLPLFKVDSDSDGASNEVDYDSDNDGIVDIIEVGGADTNGDGKVDSFIDTDGDGWANLFDSDNGGTPFGPTDTDGDGVFNQFDRDSDNDGLADIIEAGGVDLNGNGQVDNYTDTDGDGLVDVFDLDNGGTPLNVVDSDGDGKANFLDLDSDNDGLTDITEAGGIDADTNGMGDSDLDSDSDGLLDPFDIDQGGYPLSADDYDADGVLDQIDLDSDNDGIADLIEVGGTDVDGDGRVDSFLDTDGDGWANLFDTDNGGTPLIAFDTDGDGLYNLFDNDSDNDGLADIIEAGGVDTNGDGRTDFFSDADGDGLADVYDLDNGGTPLIILDSDGDGKTNFLDLDSDNDGLTDIIEAGGTDIDGNGMGDSTLDSDSDGLLDNFDVDQGGYPLSKIDRDLDGLSNEIDLDTDNDGLSDILEANGTDTNGDGKVDSFTDTDDDGWANTFDPDNGGTPLLMPDTDNDGLSNGHDLDSDNAVSYTHLTLPTNREV